MIEIDGSFGEGGGQILRTALSLSCLLKKPFRIYNIRRNRKKAGLMPQHLICVKAAQLISGAEVAGDTLGSTELLFRPNEVKGGDFLFDIGTAGSTSLVLQTLIPSLIFSDTKSSITLKGGTHVPFSPSYDYIAHVFLSVLKKMGLKIETKIESYGFYPKGGGRIKADIYSAKDLVPLNITERGEIKKLTAYSGVGNLPLSIAERQKDSLIKTLQNKIKDIECPVDAHIINALTPGQGTFVFLHAEAENSVAGFTSLGERGKKAELVGGEAAEEFISYYLSGAAFDHHLADQIVLYLSMAKPGSVFTSSRITEHLITNLNVISMFHEFQYKIEGEKGSPGTVKIM